MSQDRIDALSRSLAGSSSRRSLLTLLGVGVAGTAVTAIGFNEALAKSRKSIGPFNRLTNIPLSAEEGDRKFKGQLSVQSFEQQGQGIVAVAKVTGEVDKKHGKGTKKISRTVRVPVKFPGIAGLEAQATCTILDLVLGPIHLNLLGLHLDTNKIHIQLTAQQGGGLLGDLLCGIANLLNGGNPLGQLGQIVNLLNQILGILNGL